MVKPGEFIHTKIGVGLVLNSYYGSPNDFFGKEDVPVGDIVYPDRMIKQIEISGYIPEDNIFQEDYHSIIKGVFEEIYIR